MLKNIPLLLITVPSVNIENYFRKFLKLTTLYKSINI